MSKSVGKNWKKKVCVYVLKITFSLKNDTDIHNLLTRLKKRPKQCNRTRNQVV